MIFHLAGTFFPDRNRTELGFALRDESRKRAMGNIAAILADARRSCCVAGIETGGLEACSC